MHVRVPSRFKWFWFYLCWCKQRGWLLKKYLIYFKLSVTTLLCFGIGDKKPWAGFWVKTWVPSLGLVPNRPPTNLYSMLILFEVRHSFRASSSSRPTCWSSTAPGGGCGACIVQGCSILDCRAAIVWYQASCFWSCCTHTLLLDAVPFQAAASFGLWGSQTVDVYSSIGRTIVTYVADLIFVVQPWKLLRRKPSVLFPLATTISAYSLSSRGHLWSLPPGIFWSSPPLVVVHGDGRLLGVCSFVCLVKFDGVEAHLPSVLPTLQAL